MRTILLHTPVQHASDPVRLARMTRHLKARLLDFGPGGPEVLEADEKRGLVRARFPGRDTAGVLEALELHCGVRAAREGDDALFYLNEGVPFEDLDYVWGSLFDILI